MSNVNYVRGLHRVRVTYPLGLSVEGNASAATAILLGAGLSTSYPESSDLDNHNFIELYLESTDDGSDQASGFKMTHMITGDRTGYCYALYSRALMSTSGYGSELVGGYFVSQLSAGQVSGQVYPLCGELIIDAGVDNSPSCSVLKLYAGVSGTLNAVNAWINLETWGTHAPDFLFNFAGTSYTPGARTTMYSQAGLKIMFANATGTPIHIPVSYALPTTTAFFGRGASTSSRESMGATLTQGLSFYLTSTYTGASDASGLLVDMDSTGTSSSCKYAAAIKGVMTSGQNSEIWGAHIRAQLTGGTVTGQWGAATFEAVVDLGVANAPSGGVIQLVSWCNGSMSGDFGFINLREYGTAKCKYFIYSPDNLLADNGIFETNTDATPSHGLRIKINGTTYWLLATDTHT